MLTDSRDRLPNQRMVGSLTGVRGVAAWWVVIYHFQGIVPDAAWGSAGCVIDRGYLAVDLFFILSGFIISMNYLAEFEVFSWKIYLRFLTLRLGRIYPLHLFMLLAFLLNPLAITLLSAVQEPGRRYSAGYFEMSLLLVQNWGFAKNLGWNVPAWSISTEWFAYLIFPCVAWLGQLASTRSRAGLGIILLLLVLSGLSSLAADDIAVNGLPRCLLEFTAGSLVFLIWKRQGKDNRGLAEASTVACFCIIMTVFMLPIPPYPTAALAWCFLIHGLADRRALLSRVLSARLVFLIGEYSYSTYLVHYFIRDWIKFALVGNGAPWPVELAVYVGVTAVASLLLYRIVEVPARRLVRGLVGTSGMALSPPARVV